MRDGGLAGIFRKYMPYVHWVPIETWSTGQGVPDTNGCLQGHEFWIEFKQTKADKVNITPEQVAWAERRIRAGGKVFLAVRRKCIAGPRREAKDELHLFNATETRLIKTSGLNAGGNKRLGVWGRGPARWDWEAIGKNLITP